MKHQMIRWLIDGHVIIQRFAGTMWLEDVVTTRPLVAAMLNEALVPQVHHIIDLSQVTHVDFNEYQFVTAPGIQPTSRHPNSGVGIGILADAHLHPLFMKILPSMVRRFKAVPTVDDALYVLAALIDLPDDIHLRFDV